ncbi:MAG: hypothetical protein SOV20_08785 [Coriobacteriales bacterium]|nr:hypothetical protein [Coriobacteriaceae bacterium]MDY2723893.1 hypothetical protein [Coriobacteriales bacterium]
MSDIAAETENAAEQAAATEQDAQEPAKEPEGAGQPDYKALYEAERENARKWERRSKANLKAAKTAKEDAEKSTEERVAQLEGELQSMKAEREHAELVQRVSEEKGVPASLLTGDSEEELSAKADALLAWSRKASPKTPADKGGAAQTKHLTEADIRNIKDPVRRVKARAAMYGGQN